MADFPAAMIVGPRASGKTTTASRCAKTVVRLDRPAEAQPFEADPDVALAALQPPVLLDEWQLVPSVLPAVKRAVDQDPTKGRYVLTGSVRNDLLSDSWAATGRVIRLIQWGFCQRELEGNIRKRSWIDRVFDGEIAALRPAVDPANLRDYIEIALRGAYPPVALQASLVARKRWLASYVDQVLGRDAELIAEHRDPVRLRRYLQALAANTAGVPEHKSLFDAAGINRATAVAYDKLLEMLFVTERLPAWHHGQINRLTRSPKRFVIDAALMVPLLGIDTNAVLRDGNLLGRTLETFVIGQLRSELEASEFQPRLYHLRMDDGRREIDLVVERPDGQLIAIEIKAAAAPTEADAKHLSWFKTTLGPTVAAAVLFHTGPRVFRMLNDVWALPISCLWGR